MEPLSTTEPATPWATFNLSDSLEETTRQDLFILIGRFKNYFIKCNFTQKYSLSFGKQLYCKVNKL